MQVRARELGIVPAARALRLVPPLLAVAIVVAYALFRQLAVPTTGARAVLREQLRAYATWEREHPHECLVPLPGPTAIGNARYERHAVWFLEDQGGRPRCCATAPGSGPPTPPSTRPATDTTAT